MPSLLETNAAEIDAVFQQHLMKRVHITPQKVRSGQEFPVQPPSDLPSPPRRLSYFITKPDWKPEHGLTSRHSIPAIYSGYIGWFDGDPVALNPVPRKYTAVLPARPSGRHVMLCAWEVADTSAAFYQVIDLEYVT